MNKSNRVHARIQEFLSGGGWGMGMGSRLNGQKTVWTMFFFSHQLILQFTELIQWFYYRGEEGSNFFQGVGVSIETHMTCDFSEGGGGGGGGIASRGRFVPVFLLGNKWQLMIFMGRSGPPALSVSAHIRVSNSLDSHFIFYFLLGLVNSHGSAVDQW